MPGSRPDVHQLRTACLRGDCATATRALYGRHHAGCLGAETQEVDDEAASRALLTPLPGSDATTLLHCLAIGEPLGIGGGLLLSLAGGRHGGVWPARQQAHRAQVLALLLARQPRLALLASAPNAAGETPLHCAVRSQSWQVLALTLAALRQLFPLPGGAGALQLLVAVPNSEGLSPLELAVQLRQWPAARLLAAAAAGTPPPSQPQLEAARLVRGYLRQGGGSGSWGSGSQLSAGPLHISASGSSVTEALGGLLARVWDAFGSTPAAAAAADSLAAVERLEGQPQRHAPGADSSASGGGQVQKAAGPLSPQAVSQDEVLELVRREEAAALAAATAAAAHAGVVATGAGTEAAGAAAPAAAASSAGLAQCLVCFEDLPPGWLSVRLPCGHTTCDQCWRGILQASIDEGDPRRAMCPLPGCSAALPSTAAARLLPAPALRRFQQLLVQRYLISHPEHMRCCPQAACGATLHLAPCEQAPAAAPAAGAGPAPELAALGAVPGAGLDAACAACSHRLCWRCGEEAHEPASCAQMERWRDELAALKAAAPDADRQWLASNTKRCPRCRAHIQKHGGCNHIVCKGCGHHFCWACGRDWRQHSENTGGYYYCNLEHSSELPEYLEGSGGGGAALGPLAWLASAWSSIKAAAQQQQLQRHLRQFLRLSGGHAALHAAAAHMQLLLEAAGLADACSTSAAAPSPAPELLGVSAAEASRMASREWAQLCAAAAASAAEAAAAATPQLALPAAQASAAAALDAACGGGGGGDGSGGAGASSAPPAAAATAYLADLAAAVAAARSLLQHAAVALYQLPSGPPRRHLQQLSASMQARVEALEPLLLALPEREALPPSLALPRRLQRQSAAPARAGPTSNGRGSGSKGGLAAWLLAKWHGVVVPAAAPAAGSVHAAERLAALAASPPEALLLQVQFATAVHAQRPAIQAATAALCVDMHAMRAAARAGLYA